jgi:hypothetical protein
MIKAGQRHSSGAGKIAHGSAFVSFEAENFGSVVKNVAEAPVETSDGGMAGGSAGNASLTAG